MRFLEENTLKGAGTLTGKVVITDRMNATTLVNLTTMNLLTTFAGSMMEGFLPRGWDLAQDRRLLLASARGDRRASAVVAPALRAGRLRLGRRLRRR